MRYLIVITIAVLSLAVFKACTNHMITNVYGTPIEMTRVTKAYELFDQSNKESFLRLAPHAIIKPIKVFQIGFSKCGTCTIANFFEANGIPIIHAALSVSIYENARNGAKLISYKYEHNLVFTDMELMFADPLPGVSKMYFKELDQQYPGSKFILNTRDKQAWLKSRSLSPAYSEDKTLLGLRSQVMHLSKQEVLDVWAREWDEHHQAVLAHFKDRPQDLLVFNIEQDPPEKLCEFLKDYFVLDPTLYAHKNKTIATANNA